METEKTVQQGTEQALFLLSQKRSEMVFNELLEYATTVCLSNPPAYLTENETSRYETSAGENSIVQQLGVRSLSVLLELEGGLYRDENPSPVIKELVISPERFNHTPNFRILENVERFGQALINESFAILGSDAPAWAEKLKNTTDEDEELKAVNWLNDRIAIISDKTRSDTSDEDEAAHFYPPYRISPKLIGAYPKPELQPSCLSASIMATSFFERAGKPVIHAGVTTPAYETGTDLLATVLKSIIHKNKEGDTTENDARIEKLEGILKMTEEWTQRPLAQHAAVYTLLSSDWLQFDALNHATKYLYKAENEHFNELYKSLSEWHEIMPNIEFSTTAVADKYLNYGNLNNSGLSLVLLEYEYPESSNITQKLSEALEHIPHESYQTYLYDTCLKPLLDPQFHRSANNEESGLRNLLTAELKRSEEPISTDSGAIDSNLRRLFEKTLHTFVQWEEAPEIFIERCATDPQYRSRRAQDFLHLPELMAMYNSQIIAQEGWGLGHTSIDIGSPAMRIGLSVLSDFAVYDDHPLPASFWMSHWPGAVSILENLDNPPASDKDWKLTYNGLLAKLNHPFTSMHNYDKINSFLSTYQKD